MRRGDRQRIPRDESAKTRLFARGTEDSNLVSSSGGCVSLPHPLSKVENLAFRAGVRGWLGRPGSKGLFLRDPPNRGLLIGGKAFGARYDERRRACRQL